MSNPFDEASRTKCQEIITDTLGTFGKSYPLAYVKAVVRKIKDEKEEEKPPARCLLDEPAPGVRKEGWLHKNREGLFGNKWKRRYFVVDGSYRISWYETEALAKKPLKEKEKRKTKGEFSAFGYRLKDEKEKKPEKKEGEKKEGEEKKGEEKKDAPAADGAAQFEFRLKPYWDEDKTKQVFTFRAETKEEESAWKKMFQECIWYAPNPMHSDNVRRSAFAETYMDLEKTRGWGGWYFWPTGSESDMLACFIFRRISYEVLSPTVYQNLPSAPMLRDKAISAIDSTVGKMIGPAVATAWAGAGKAIDAIEKPTEEKIRQAVGPLFEAIKKMKDAVQAKFEEKVGPVIHKLMEPITTKLFPKLFHPLQKCMEKLISEFSEHKDSPRGTWHLYWAIREKLDDFDDLLGIAREILDVPELGEFTTKVNDACCNLLERAQYTYKTHTANKVADAFVRTCDELLHDALLEIRLVGKWLLEALVLKPFNEAFVPIIEELCAPLADLIPEAIKEFLSPVDTIKEMASNAVSGALKALLSSGGDQSAALITKFGEKGTQGVKVISGPQHYGGAAPAAAAAAPAAAAEASAPAAAAPAAEAAAPAPADAAA